MLSAALLIQARFSVVTQEQFAFEDESELPPLLPYTPPPQHPGGPNSPRPPTGEQTRAYGSPAAVCHLLHPGGGRNSRSPSSAFVSLKGLERIFINGFRKKKTQKKQNRKGSFAGGSRGSHNNPGGGEPRRRRERRNPLILRIPSPFTSHLGSDDIHHLQRRDTELPSRGSCSRGDPSPPKTPPPSVPAGAAAPPNPASPRSAARRPRCGSQTNRPQNTTPGHFTSAPTLFHRIRADPHLSAIPGSHLASP